MFDKKNRTQKSEHVMTKKQEKSSVKPQFMKNHPSPQPKQKDRVSDTPAKPEIQLKSKQKNAHVKSLVLKSEEPGHMRKPMKVP